MFSFPNMQVVRSLSENTLKPQTAVTIAVDTAYVASQQGRNITQGVYMMDNMIALGSTSEAQMELHTRMAVGQLIGFHTVPINGEGPSGDTVIITGFTVSQGNVFGSSGYPRQQPALPNELAGSYWIGQAMNQGTQTYQIQIKVTVGRLQPVSYYINWDPFITAS